MSSTIRASAWLYLTLAFSNPYFILVKGVSGCVDLGCFYFSVPSNDLFSSYSGLVYLYGSNRKALFSNGLPAGPASNYLQDAGILHIAALALRNGTTQRNYFFDLQDLANGTNARVFSSMHISNEFKTFDVLDKSSWGSIDGYSLTVRYQEDNSTTESTASFKTSVSTLDYGSAEVEDVHKEYPDRQFCRYCEE